MAEQPHDAPFEGTLQRSSYVGMFMDSSNTVGEAWGKTNDEKNARRDHIILCVNAHAKLVKFARRYRMRCEIERRMTEHAGYDVLASSWADDIREIDDALALAEPPCESEKLEATIADENTD